MWLCYRRGLRARFGLCDNALARHHNSNLPLETPVDNGVTGGIHHRLHMHEKCQVRLVFPRKGRKALPLIRRVQRVASIVRKWLPSLFLTYLRSRSVRVAASMPPQTFASILPLAVPKLLHAQDPASHFRDLFYHRYRLSVLCLQLSIHASVVGIDRS